MKIYIVGPSGCGKTTLACFLSKSLGREMICLDDMYIDFKRTLPGHVFYRTDSEVLGSLKKVLNKPDWLVEGSYVIDQLEKSADYVVYAKKNPLIRIVLIWKRYLENKEVRKKYGFVNTLTLTIGICKQVSSKSYKTSFFGTEFLTTRGYDEYIKGLPQKKVLLFEDFDFEGILKKMV